LRRAWDDPANNLFNLWAYVDVRVVASTTTAFHKTAPLADNGGNTKPWEG